MEVTELGKNISKVDDLGKRTLRAFEAAIENSIDFRDENVLKDTLTIIRENVINDEINENSTELREAFDRLDSQELSHVVTGELLSSIREEVDFNKTRGVTDITFGYFVSHGLNLELGNPDGSSRAYPIIIPVWEDRKELIKNDIFHTTGLRFKNELRKFTGVSARDSNSIGGL